MTSIQPGWLGLTLVVIVVVAIALAAVGVFYGLVPPGRRFIKGDRPVWWVRDGLIAVVVAVLVLFGHSYVLAASSAPERGQTQDEGQAQRISNVDFVRFRSSESYQARPFRQFDLSNTNLAGLELAGSDLTGANLSGANLAGTKLSAQLSTPATPAKPATASAPAFLQGVNFCHADLTGADLRYAYLMYANLTGVDLTFTRLEGAVLNGSDLSAATLPYDPSSLEGVYYDETTMWPEGFQPPPSAIGNRLDFLEKPINSKLYGDVQLPECDS